MPARYKGMSAEQQSLACDNTSAVKDFPGILAEFRSRSAGFYAEKEVQKKKRRKIYVNSRVAETALSA